MNLMWHVHVVLRWLFFAVFAPNYILWVLPEIVWNMRWKCLASNDYPQHMISYESKENNKHTFVEKMLIMVQLWRIGHILEISCLLPSSLPEIATLHLNKKNSARLHNTVGSSSDCRSRGGLFESQLGHITFMVTDQEIISAIVLHPPLIQEGQL